jgi:hypothetical protein
MQGKTHYANGQPIFRQEGDTLTYFFKTGLKKARGARSPASCRANGASGARRESSGRSGIFGTDRNTGHGCATAATDRSKSTRLSMWEKP